MDSFVPVKLISGRQPLASLRDCHRELADNMPAVRHVECLLDLRKRENLLHDRMELPCVHELFDCIKVLVMGRVAESKVDLLHPLLGVLGHCTACTPVHPLTLTRYITKSLGLGLASTKKLKC